MEVQELCTMFIHVRYPNSIGKFLPSSLFLLQGNVLLGGFGTDGSSAAAGPGAKGRQDVSEVSAMGFVGMLFGAKKVVIVPGSWSAVCGFRDIFDGEHFSIQASKKKKESVFFG
jgi:hypothetical protein